MTQTKFPTLLELSLAPRIPPSSRQLPKDVQMPHSRLRQALFLQTQLMYKWAQPKICGEDLEGAVKLPASGMKTSCPPCNPGFFKSNSSTCEPCPYGSYSNGSGNPSPIPLPAPLQPHPQSSSSYKSLLHILENISYSAKSTFPLSFHFPFLNWEF